MAVVLQSVRPLRKLRLLDIWITITLNSSLRSREFYTMALRTSATVSMILKMP